MVSDSPPVWFWFSGYLSIYAKQCPQPRPRGIRIGIEVAHVSFLGFKVSLHQISPNDVKADKVIFAFVMALFTPIENDVQFKCGSSCRTYFLLGSMYQTLKVILVFDTSPILYGTSSFMFIIAQSPENRLLSSHLVFVTITTLNFFQKISSTNLWWVRNILLLFHASFVSDWRIQTVLLYSKFYVTSISPRWLTVCTDQNKTVFLFRNLSFVCSLHSLHVCIIE